MSNDENTRVAGSIPAVRASQLSLAMAVKRTGSFLLLGLLLSGGCARHYVITLNNGARIGTRSKPELKGNSYVYKSVTGKTSSIPAGGVAQIAPASMAKDKGSFFGPSSSQ